MRDILIGIDAGTSVIKSVAFDLGGRQITACAIANSYESEGGKGVVQDLNRTWADAAKTLAGLAGKVENLASRVAAISVTGQGDGTWLIDKNGDPRRQGLALARCAGR
jgi:erythritol kinase